LTAKRFFINSNEINFPWTQIKGSEHHHLCHVLRKKPGDIIIIFDERGVVYRGKIIDIEKQQTSILLLDKQPPPPREVMINLGLGILKAKTMDLVIQKATEWGVARIWPLLTSRSVVKLGEKWEKKIIRWHQIAVEAAKQSGQVLLPQIKMPLSLEQFLENCSAPRKYLLSESSGELLWKVLEEMKGENTSGVDQLDKEVILLIGPEGGWTEKEQKYMMSHGFKAVSLGPYVLRAETAAISSVAIIAHFFMREAGDVSAGSKSR
jgi:16S rRNA (uracil1498-N3)-methyltransferase